MSNIDELEEYDAELELRLKKEYADVYGLFRYCVLTQEATYLCNQLDLKIEHQPFGILDAEHRVLDRRAELERNARIFLRRPYADRRNLSGRAAGVNEKRGECGCHGDEG